MNKQNNLLQEKTTVLIYKNCRKVRNVYLESDSVIGLG